MWVSTGTSSGQYSTSKKVVNGPRWWNSITRPRSKGTGSSLSFMYIKANTGQKASLGALTWMKINEPHFQSNPLHRTTSGMRTWGRWVQLKITHWTSPSAPLLVRIQKVHLNTTTWALTNSLSILVVTYVKLDLIIPMFTSCCVHLTLLHAHKPSLLFC